MASSAKRIVPAADLQSFSEYLGGCKRIVALLGAGISASSGLPTFRGAGGLWRSHDATSLATPEAFDETPDLVWQFYSYRRHMALQADPNKAHYALAELSRRNEDFITLSQNVDGLSQRANHPSKQLHLLHGTLFNVKCTNFYCNYSEENYTDPIVPALEIPKQSSGLNPSATDKTGEEASKAIVEALGSTSNEVDISDASNPLATVNKKELPQCPRCKDGLLRPGVVWFGEPLPEKTLNAVDKWIAAGPIDLCLVIGTSARIWPAAGYVHEARSQGARVAVCNMDPKDTPGELHDGDWFFQGDAGVIVPEILKSVIGEI
ncbi:Sirtuin family [Penicillium expansum]|uniref:Sirtuin family n=1 Tax=Penicillium expansum TaxID=27334 RepID=A0A0A2K3B9_PENEN|nr:Sirtuin family [Penicillium expansum]KAJ5506391.1 Sirtuin family [Penicillium expansum]KGO40993.1 Sirtuin family [Penicillium expansum]KGO47132.1 Sirtuin family [Penicillium expansum]KGO58940.1 Sirtuin family [Penicillium expansum]